MKLFVLCSLLVILKVSQQVAAFTDVVPTIDSGSSTFNSATLSSLSGGSDIVKNDDEDIEYDHTVFNPNLPLSTFPDFDDFDVAESFIKTSPLTFSSSPSSSSSSSSHTLSSSVLQSLSPLSSNLPLSLSSSASLPVEQTAESVNMPVSSGFINKLELKGNNHLLANLTAEQKNTIVEDAFKRFIKTAQNTNKDIKPEESDRLSALKSYLSHLKKEEMEKFKFSSNINSDWVPLISTKASENSGQNNEQNFPKNHSLEKSSRLLESSPSPDSSPTILKSFENLKKKTLDETKKIAQIYHDNNNEVLEEKDESNYYSGNQIDSFKKYLSCCDQLFNKFGSVDEKIYEDMYISPVRHRFNPGPKISLPATVKTHFQSPISNSYYSYPLRQPPSYSPSMVRTYNLRSFPRDHIQTTVQLTTIPEAISSNSDVINDPSNDCFADPHHFYHSHRRLLQHPFTTTSSSQQYPVNFQQRSNYLRSMPRHGWLAQKKHSIFGRKSYFG